MTTCLNPDTRSATFSNPLQIGNVIMTAVQCCVKIVENIREMVKKWKSRNLEISIRKE